MERSDLIVACPSCGTKNRIAANRMGENPICGRCRASLGPSGTSTKPVDATDHTFQSEVVEHTGPVLVDCWAPWCGPCKMVAPVLDELAAQYSGKVKIVKLNIDENPLTASRYQIQSIPTMLLFRNGQQINRLVGALPKQEIERHLRSVL